MFCAGAQLADETDPHEEAKRQVPTRLPPHAVNEQEPPTAASTFVPPPPPPAAPPLPPPPPSGLLPLLPHPATTAHPTKTTERRKLFTRQPPREREENVRRAILRRRAAFPRDTTHRPLRHADGRPSTSVSSARSSSAAAPGRRPCRVWRDPKAVEQGCGRRARRRLVPPLPGFDHT